MTELSKVSAMPAVPATKFSIGQRTFARMINVDVTKEPANDVERDFVGDVFNSLYNGAESVDNVPAEREINRHLLDWMKEQSSFEPMARAAAMNLPAALTGANMLSEFARNDEALKAASDAQAKAAEAQREADLKEMQANALEQAKHADASKARQQAAAARAAAQKLQGEAVKLVEDAQKSPMTKGLVKKAVEAAAKDAQEMAAITAGFGSEAGAGGVTDVKAAMDLMKRVSPKIRQIAKLAGRLRGIAFNARATRKSDGHRPIGVKFTQDVPDIFASEIAKLSPAAGALRYPTMVQFADFGLQGVMRGGEQKEAGPFVAGIDVSGSMDGDREIRAKSLALGLAQVAKSEHRAYELFSFSTKRDGLIECSSSESWDAHMAWGEKTISGGTDFNFAIAEAMKKIAAMGKAGHNADLVFISDGDARVNDKTVEAWSKFKAETGARILYVAVAHSMYDDMRKLADLTVDVPDLDAETVDQLARDIGSWMQ